MNVRNIDHARDIPLHSDDDSCSLDFPVSPLHCDPPQGFCFDTADRWADLVSGNMFQFKNEVGYTLQRCQELEKEVSNLKAKLLEIELQKQEDENKRVNSPWCKINVGGKKFETSLENLIKFPQSNIANIFSSEHIKVDCDEYNNIARDGTHFRHILNYLIDPEYFDISKLKSLSATDLWELKIEALYYGLFDRMFPDESVPEKRVNRMTQKTESSLNDDENDAKCVEGDDVLAQFADSGRISIGGRRGSARLNRVPSKSVSGVDLQQTPFISTSLANASDKRNSVTPKRRGGSHHYCTTSELVDLTSESKQSNTKAKQHACKDETASKKQKKMRMLESISSTLRESNSAVVISDAQIYSQQKFAIDPSAERLDTSAPKGVHNSSNTTPFFVTVSCNSGATE